MQAKFPHWSETLVRLAAGALEVYRSRYTDVFVRGFVALIWVMIGEDYLRAHNGVYFLSTAPFTLAFHRSPSSI